MSSRGGIAKVVSDPTFSSVAKIVSDPTFSVGVNFVQR
jgi:hypothetical protein